MSDNKLTPNIDSNGNLWVFGICLGLSGVDTLLSDEFQSSLRALRSEMEHGTWRKCKDQECECHYWGTREYCCDFCEQYDKERANP